MKKTLGLALAFSTLALSSALAQGTLYFGINNEPGTLDPYINPGTAGRTIKLAVHRGLVNYGTDGALSPELAESWEVSPDGKEMTFHLRAATFHDGAPVTADDVRATFERITAADSAASFRNEFAVIEAIETPDDKTVVFRLSTPSVSLLHFMALPESVIVPRAWIEAVKTDPNTPQIGAGPFKMVEYARGREVVVEKYDGYYKQGKPYLDEVHYVFYPDDTTRMNAVRSEDADIVDYVPGKDYESLVSDPEIKMLTTYGPFMGLQINTSFEPFSHPEVREALALAVDPQLIINTAFAGRGKVIHGIPLPENSMGWTAEGADRYHYDPEKAKALLAEAGYPNGFEVRLLAAQNPNFHRDTAVAIQSELAKIGIKVNLDLPDWSGRMAKAAVGDYDFSVLGSVGEITDPDWLFNYYYGGEQLVRTNNSPYFQDAEMDRLLVEGRSVTDPAERAKVYEQIVARANELTPIVYYMSREQAYATRDTVSGFVNMPGFLSFQSGFSIEDTQIE